MTPKDSGDPEVLVRKEGRLGRLTLNRAGALHALNTNMCGLMIEALLAWRDDPEVTTILVDHADGTRGFCAGGDIRMLAESGFLVFSVDYRLVQEGGVLPNSVRDVKTALCWFRKEGLSRGLDPKRVGSLGESAGGTIVSLLSTTAGLPDFAPYGEYAKNCDDSVVATVAVFPATDFSTLKTNLAKMVKGEMQRANGARSKEALAELMKKQSPITYADRACPMMFIHGANDILVTVDQSRSMHAKLKSLGKETEYIELADAPHGFFGENFTKPEYDKVRQAAIDYLKKYLGK